LLGYIYTFTNGYNGKSFSIGLNDDGTTPCDSGRGVMLTAYPDFSLVVRNDSRNKAGQHGTWDFFSFYGQRNISFQGQILGSSHEDLMYFQQKIKTVLSLPSQPIENINDGYVTINWTDVWGDVWQINAKIQADMQFSRDLGHQTQGTFLINMKASTPYIISTTTYTELQLRGWRDGGMYLPAYLPGTLNILYHNLISIYQNGTSDAPGTYRVYGPGTNLKISKLTPSLSNSITISNFTSGWIGGTDDILHYLNSEKARKLTSTGSQDTMQLPIAIDLSGEEYITFYFYVDDSDNFAIGDYASGQNYIKFINTAGVDEFVIDISSGNQTIKDGWNYFMILKQQFEVIGTPSWETITSVELSIKAKTATTLNVTFDILLSTDITFTEQKLELNTVLAASEYVDFNTLDGTITKNDGTDMSIYLTADSTWFYVDMGVNLFICESVDANPVTTFELPYTFKDPVDSPNIIGYWHFDEESLTDYVGNYDGIMVGTGANYYNSSIRGSQKYLDLPGGVYFHMITPFKTFSTLSKCALTIRARTTSFSSNFRILDRFFGNTNSNLRYDQASDTLKLTYSIDGAPITISTPTGFATTYGINTWFDILVNFDVSSGVQLYIDNILVGSSVVTGTLINTSDLTCYVGATSTGTNSMIGGVDELRFYNTDTIDSDTRELLYYDASQEKYKNQVSITWNNSIL